MHAQLLILLGAPILFLAVFFTIIFFKRKQDEGRWLEKQVQERTLELSRYQRDLEEALAAAKHANNSKTTFLANMSHEIRTPMNSIMGFSELAMDSEASPKTRDYLEKIQTNTEWLLQIINDILDISKIESGKMDLEYIPFDIHEIIASCRSIVMPKAEEKGIILHFYAEPNVGKKPLGDPTRLRQVFVNLLSNAIKFTNIGMVKLFSQVKNITDDKISMHFEIKDSGIGMTNEQIDRIFNPFTQAESGTTRKYGGTGLGLAISKNIVEMMGGKLYVDSTLGIGSKFSFDITFNTIDAGESEYKENDTRLNEIEKPNFTGEILVCEDNYMNRQVICEHLARVGFETFVAENGRIGLDMVKERLNNNIKQFDLIFMDMHMPVMDGFEAAAEIINLKLDIPIVAMTANVMHEDMEIYKASGMPDCVSKPFTSQGLWRCLLKYFTPVKHEEPQPADSQQKFERLEDDSEFFRSLQQLFITNNTNRFADIIKALEKEDLKLAHRLVHSLKSNSGQIGLKKLQNAAIEIEKPLREGKNTISKEQLKVLEDELKSALNELRSL